jgi:hypothetical protein
MKLRNRTGVITLAMCAALLLLTTGAMAVPMPSFVNGGFEAGYSVGGWDVMTATNTPGWTILYGSTGAFPRLNRNIANGGPYGNNNELTQFATIGNFEDGSTSALEQAVSGFNVGQTYTLSWMQSSEFTSMDQLQVSFVAGSNTASQIFASNPYPCGGCFWQGWQTFSMNFVPSAGSVTFHFQGVPNTNSYEVGVDAFQISGGTSTPEPGTLIMLGSGVIGLAGMLRRKISL